MKSKSSSSRKAADEDEAKPKKVRSSRDKRRRGRRRRSSSGSDFPSRKRSKKLKTADKKSTKNKGGSRRRHRSLSLSTSPSSSSRRYSSRSSSSSSASERSVSPPPRSRSRDVRKKKERGRDSKRGRRPRRSRSDSTSAGSSSSSRSRSRSKNSKNRKRRSGGNRDHSSRDKIAKDHDNCHAYRVENTNSIGDADMDKEAMAVSNKGNPVDHEKNMAARKTESPPTKNADETEDILPAGSGSPDADNLELILRQKALENFRKFRGAAVMAGKMHTNGTGKEAATDSPKSSNLKLAESSSVSKPFQRERSGIAVNCSVGSPRLEDLGNRTTPFKPESSAAMRIGAKSPGIFEAGSTSGPTEQKGGSLEATHSNSEITLQDGKNSCGIVQRLPSIPGSPASAKQMLGTSPGVSYTNGNPRIRSVVSIPTKEGLDGGTSITPRSACDKSPPVESISEVSPPTETKKLEGTNVDERKSDEASAPNASTLSISDGKGQPGTEGRDGSQFEKKTFSRMHEGETVQVSYKVYIPKKSTGLARRKLQR